MPTIKYINKFSGYQNYQDITNMPVSSLAPGSQNVFIEDSSKLEPRAGMAYFGAIGTQGIQSWPYWTLAHRIHSKYDEFVNKIGVKIPLRVYYSGNISTGDMIDVWLPIYSAGIATSNKKWYQITATSPSAPQLLNSEHRYYFAEWYNGIVSNQQAQNAKSQPELIFTNGSVWIGNWSGGFAPVTVVTLTTIKTNKSWAEYGFIGSPEGIDLIIVNGVEYIVIGGFSTDTITVASTAGINVNDLAFQSIFQAVNPNISTKFDVCSAINNQVYYIDWNQRNVFMSWNRNQVSAIGNTIFSGTGLNDAILSLPSPLVGQNNIAYKVNIYSVNPDFEEQSYTSNSINGLNDAIFEHFAPYTANPGQTNVYKVVVVADFTLVVVGAPAYQVGEVVTGGTSNSTARIVQILLNGPNTELGVVMITGSFQATPAETITGNSTGIVANSVQAFYQNWIQYYKNQTLTVCSSGPVTNFTVPLFNSPPDTVLLTDGLRIIFGNYYGHVIGDFWKLTINKGGTDTFQYSENNGPLSAPIIITGAAQALGANGGVITFKNITDHNVGDSWSATAVPTVTRGWSDFTYTNPDRLPGQGMVIVLDSNGWTMKPQESTMLINAAAGHFYDVTLKLSSDLKSEAVEVKRLKSEPQNKILFPYLINYIKNQLTTISNEKTFDVLGRQKFLELQQSKTLSDIVRVDFATVDWEDADVLYFKRKIFFSVPRTTSTGKGACIFIWDDYKKYWHSPMIFGKRIGLLSVIDEKLIGHSYEMNESYELFTGLNDLGIFPIKTRIIMPYDSAGNRYNEKATNAIGFEGYILGSPVINWTVNSGVGGCEGQKHGTIKPFMCLPIDKASLGKSSLGYHGLGNDPVDVIPHFFYIKPFDNQMFYQRNIEITCDSMEQRWSLISLGTTIEAGNINNVSITDPD